jgi:hypothetical protein
MFGRRIIGSGAAITLVLAPMFALHAQAATRGAACVLSGSATISPGLTATARAQSVTLSNVKLANCHSGSTSSPNTKATSATVTTSPNPVSTTASCVSGNLTLTATITWADGNTTTGAISTKGVLANQAITGKVTSSSEPALAAGDTIAGDVVFKPTTAAQNCAKVPVTAVTFTGVLASGSPK